LVDLVDLDSLDCLDDLDDLVDLVDLDDLGVFSTKTTLNLPFFSSSKGFILSAKLVSTLLKSIKGLGKEYFFFDLITINI
jgi:hypothetical protein